MIVDRVKRGYSKSINSKNYGLPEGWVKVTADFEGVPESSDDPIHCGEVLFDAAKKQVMGDCNEIISKMKEAAAALRGAVAAHNSAAAFTTTNNPVQPAAPMTTLTVPVPAPVPAAPAFQPVGAVPPVRSQAEHEALVDKEMANLENEINKVTEGGANPGALFPDTNPEGGVAANEPRPL